jgi:hypothetical protein
MAIKKSKTGRIGEEIKTKDAVALLGIRPDQFGAVASGLEFRKDGVSKYYLLADIERIAKARGVKVTGRGRKGADKTPEIDGRSKAAKAAKAKGGTKTTKTSVQSGERIKTKDAVALLGIRPDQFGEVAKGLDVRKEGVAKTYLRTDIERIAKERGEKSARAAAPAKARDDDGDRINTREASHLLGVTRVRFLDATKGLETKTEGVSKTYLRADILALAKKGIPRGKPGRPAAGRSTISAAASLIASAQASFSAQEEEELPPASSARPTFHVNLPPEPEGLTPELVRVVVSYLSETTEWNANDIMIKFGARPSQITYLQAFYRSEQDRITYEQQVREYEQKRVERKAAAEKAEAERKAAAEKAEAERKAAAEKEEAERAEARRVAAEKAAAEKVAAEKAAEKALAAAEQDTQDAADKAAAQAASAAAETATDLSPNPTHAGYNGDDPEESGAAALDRQFGVAAH